MHDTAIEWYHGSTQASDLADFFVRNVDTTYISYGEILCERAVDPQQWSANLRDNVQRELAECLEPRELNSGGRRAIVAHICGRLVGLAVVSFSEPSEHRFCCLEDLVVNREDRGSGVGSLLLRWIEDAAMNEGATLMVLESGISNVEAHRFFGAAGYRVIAQAMAKTLTPSRRGRECLQETPRDHTGESQPPA